ncbi:MAG: TolC family protein [bacterium]|nr:TolC family protein [bacterium]
MNQAINSTVSIVRRAGAVVCFLLLAMPGLLAATELGTKIQRELGDEVHLTVEDEHVNLPLDEAIALALERNLPLVVERYTRNRSLFGIQEGRGVYDLNVQAFVQLDSNISPPFSTLESAEIVETENTIANLYVRQPTPIGGTAQLRFLNRSTETSDQAYLRYPLIQVGVDLIYEQPLLRDFGRLTTERNLLVARRTSAISREDFQARVEAVIQQVSDAYWGLVEAREQLAVADESMSLAKDLHKMNRIQVEVGTLAPLEMVQSEATVAARMQDIIQRRATVEDSADTLRQLMNLDRGELWDVPIAPVTKPEIPHSAIDVEAAVETALENRLEIRQRKLDNEIREIDAKVARNQKLPRLDGQLIWGYNALDGDYWARDPTTGERITVSEPGGWSDAIRQISNREYEGWTVNLTLVYPVQNRIAKARSARADLYRDQGRVELRQLEQQILVGVRRAARSVDTSAQQIESAKVATKLAVRNLEAEQKRYENGLTTSFGVLEIQEDLSQARSREVAAVISYRRALVSYHLAIGKLLEETGVTLADDAADAP